jgi:hypothetical protein
LALVRARRTIEQPVTRQSRARGDLLARAFLKSLDSSEPKHHVIAAMAA